MPFDPAILIFAILAAFALVNHLHNSTDEYE